MRPQRIASGDGVRVTWLSPWRPAREECRYESGADHKPAGGHNTPARRRRPGRRRDDGRDHDVARPGPLRQLGPAGARRGDHRAAHDLPRDADRLAHGDQLRRHRPRDAVRRKRLHVALARAHAVRGDLDRLDPHRLLHRGRDLQPYLFGLYFNELVAYFGITGIDPTSATWSAWPSSRSSGWSSSTVASSCRSGAASS
jgi:hypothetical protein